MFTKYLQTKFEGVSSYQPEVTVETKLHYSKCSVESFMFYFTDL